MSIALYDARRRSDGHFWTNPKQWDLIKQHTYFFGNRSITIPEVVFATDNEFTKVAWSVDLFYAHCFLGHGKYFENEYSRRSLIGTKIGKFLDSEASPNIHIDINKWIEWDPSTTWYPSNIDTNRERIEGLKLAAERAKGPITPAYASFDKALKATRAALRVMKEQDKFLPEELANKWKKYATWDPRLCEPALQMFYYLRESTIYYGRKEKRQMIQLGKEFNLEGCKRTSEPHAFFEEIMKFKYLIDSVETPEDYLKRRDELLEGTFSSQITQSVTKCLRGCCCCLCDESEEETSPLLAERTYCGITVKTIS